MDKRVVLFLVAKDDSQMTDITTARGVKQKTSTVLEYNQVKSYIDVSDQVASDATTVRGSEVVS